MIERTLLTIITRDRPNIDFVRLEFKLPDLWIGAFWKTTDLQPTVFRTKRLDVWICLLPCLPIHIRWHYWPKDKSMNRVLIRIVDVDRNQERLEMIIPSWHPRESVYRPIGVIPKALRSNLQPGTRLIARVNIDATAARELKFSDFEIAAEPVDLPE